MGVQVTDAQEDGEEPRRLRLEVAIRITQNRLKWQPVSMDLWFTGSGSDWAKKENMINVCTNNDFSNLVKKRLAVDLELLLQTRDN